MPGARPGGAVRCCDQAGSQFKFERWREGASICEAYRRPHARDARRPRTPDSKRCNARAQLEAAAAFAIGTKQERTAAQSVVSSDINACAGWQRIVSRSPLASSEI